MGAVSFEEAIGPNTYLRVEVPLDVQREIASTFMVSLRSEIDRIAHRYAPNHREFLADLRDSVVAGIEPHRLGRGGIHSFVDRVAYRIWLERQATPTGRAGTVPPEQVVRPAPATGEIPLVTGE